MIIWLNGPFGAGKTTLAHTLRERKPDLLLFDPEEVGFLVRKLLPPAESWDYQDLPVWRGLTATALAEIRRHYSQDIIVPMTLVRPGYLNELIGGLIRRGEDVLHVFLTVDERVLRDRIERQTMSPERTRNEQIRAWRLAQIDRCLSARDLMPDGTRFLDMGLHTPDVLTDTILEWLGALQDRPSRHGGA
jgi:hypothetical protein